jgi:hypothetical protein
VQRIFLKKCFLLMVGRVCFIKRFTTWWKTFADEEVEIELRKWLIQRSEDLYASSFDAQVKRWVKCINVGGGYVKKYFFQVEISHILRFISICELFTDSLSYKELYFPTKKFSNK